MHDAFVIIFTHIDHLRDETKLVHWMTVIVRNLALRQAKATEERRRLHEVMTEELADDDSPPSSSVIPMERLLEAIETLPRGYGEVFRLAVLDGLSHEEIGQLLGIAPAQFVVATWHVQTHVEKALGRLPTAPYLAGGGGRLDLQAAQHAPASGTFDGRPASPSASKGDASRGTQGCASGRKRKARSRSRVYRSPQRANATEVFHDFSDASAIVRATHRRSSQICRTLRSASRFVAKRRHRCAADCRRRNRRSTVGNDVHIPSPVARKHYPWTVNFGGGAATASSNSPIKFDYLSLTDHANGGVRRKIHSWQELSDYLAANQTLLDSLERAQLNRMLYNNAPNQGGTPNLNETERHQRPVTVGLSVGKQLGERWYFGTGVSYTRLNSEFESAFHKGRIQKRQRIDYVGLPLRLTYRVWQNGRFNVYATGGATFEWPVRATQNKAYIESADSVTPLRTHFSAPCQWSMQMGAGVEYRLVRPFTLFVEPSVTHYFGTGTPVRTYRTEHPWSVAVPFGIRLTW